MWTEEGYLQRCTGGLGCCFPLLSLCMKAAQQRALQSRAFSPVLVQAEVRKLKSLVKMAKSKLSSFHVSVQHLLGSCFWMLQVSNQFNSELSIPHSRAQTCSISGCCYTSRNSKTCRASGKERRFLLYCLLNMALKSHVRSW